MHRRTILLLALVALTLVSPSQMHAWQLADASLREVRVPAGIQLVLPATSADFDNDGKAETLALRDGRAAIQREDQILWQSPQAWQVRQALIADLNQDGRPEAVLLVWRPFRPWPVDAWLPHGGRIDDFHDSSGRSCHIILIGWYQDSFRELEAQYNDPVSAPARDLKVWEWNGFGFSLVSTIEGPFSQMAITQAKNGQILILVP
jgi:hypothetical protein